MARQDEGDKSPDADDGARSCADKWRDRAVELAALAGFSDPFRFSLRELDLAARARRREDWDRVALLRVDLRRLLAKNKDRLFLCDYNPVYSKEERAAIKRRLKRDEAANAPQIGSAELFAIVSGAAGTAPKTIPQ